MSGSVAVRHCTDRKTPKWSVNFSLLFFLFYFSSFFSFSSLLFTLLTSNCWPMTAKLHNSINQNINPVLIKTKMNLKWSNSQVVISHIFHQSNNQVQFLLPLQFWTKYIWTIWTFFLRKYTINTTTTTIILMGFDAIEINLVLIQQLVFKVTNWLLFNQMKD